MEAVLQGIPAIAISQVCVDKCQNIDALGYDLAKEIIADIVKRILDDKFPLPERKFLNINIPPIKSEACKGFRITRAGNRYYGNDAHVHRNPRGLEYYWIGLPHLDWLPTEGHITDFEAINQNYVSITPIHLDMTSHDDIRELEEWL
jgi:5'-nucleotidase